MPVLEATDKIAPRSALRHRPLESPPYTSGSQPPVQRASRVRPELADDDLVSEWQRAGTREQRNRSTPASRRTGSSAARRAAGNAKNLSGITSSPARRRLPHLRLHPGLFLGLGMLTMLVFWTLLTAGLNWWNDAMDSLHYGYPRTSQVDAVVGHTDSTSDPSHFLATNLHGRIEIIEFPGGDGTHARIFLGPQLFGPNADKIPVTLKFADVNGDHRPDMLVHFQSSWIVFINDQGDFRAPTSQERQDAQQYLTTHGQE